MKNKNDKQNKEEFYKEVDVVASWLLTGLHRKRVPPSVGTVALMQVLASVIGSRGIPPELRKEIFSYITWFSELSQEENSKIKNKS